MPVRAESVARAAWPRRPRNGPGGAAAGPAYSEPARARSRPARPTTRAFRRHRAPGARAPTRARPHARSRRCRTRPRPTRRPTEADRPSSVVSLFVLYTHYGGRYPRSRRSWSSAASSPKVETITAPGTDPRRRNVVGCARLFHRSVRPSSPQGDALLRQRAMLPLTDDSDPTILQLHVPLTSWLAVCTSVWQGGFARGLRRGRSHSLSRLTRSRRLGRLGKKPRQGRPRSRRN